MDVFLPLAGFVVGVIVGLTGVGGGALMTPLLIFGMGISPGVAVGTDLLFAGITKSVGVYAHKVADNVDWQLAGWLAAGSLPTSLFVIVIVGPGSGFLWPFDPTSRTSGTATISGCWGV